MGSNAEWFFIVARDGMSRGYMPAQNKEEACKNFGLKPEECSVKKVEWSGKEFVEINQSEQKRLF